MSGTTPSRELRSAELVSRLLAATPPYLYNMPIVPNSYFFSEMLRSFVAAKNNPDRQPLGQSTRRSRKRSWGQCASKDKPLELTTAHKDEDPPKSPGPPPPPPQPVWYPPLYPPPYPVDPLNLFIDLRVSGQIYDRKQADLFRDKAGSAFKVPKPRAFANFYDDDDDQHRSTSTTGAHYVMQNLKRIYADLKDKLPAEDDDEVERKRRKDLSALIGLELVVDYVKDAK